MGQGNGKMPPGESMPSTPEEAAEMQQALINAMAHDVASFLQSQEADAPAQAKINAVQRSVEEHMQLPGFLELRKQIEPAKLFGFKITHQDGRMCQFMALKRFEDCTKAEEVTATAMLIAMCTSPYARAALGAHGWRIEFVQARIEKKSPIFIPGA